MVKFKCSLLLTFLCFLESRGSEEDECQSALPKISSRFSTKTPYRVVKNLDDAPIEFDGCQPTQIIGVIRHGTRTAGNKYLERLQELISLRDEIMEGKGQKGDLCKKDTKKLKKWKPVLFDGEKHLTHEGEDEMLDMAERWKSRFPTLIGDHYNENDFYFRYTDTQRTAESARWFATGLFGRKEMKHVKFPEPIYKDPLIRFYKLCDEWQTKVKNNPETKKEFELYKDSPEMMGTRERISQTLGLNYTLSYDMVQTMYDTCCFETAWHKDKVCAWCSVFEDEDLENMEYAADMKHYWADGYGNEINYIQACPLLKHIITHFIEGQDPKVIFYFTHSGTILKLLSHLGLYRDNFNLTHDLNPESKNNRLWRLSRIDTFASNVVFVNYQCKGGESRVLVLHQERPVRLPSCDQDLCPLSDLEKKYQNTLNCDFDKICSL